MRIVVCDTSPIRALAHLGFLRLLEQLYGEVFIPRAVATELSQPPLGQFVLSPVELAKLHFVKVQPVADVLRQERFQRELDPGESEALTLAIELRADLILMDELLGRSVAKREGFAVIGVLGVLLEAKHQGLVASIEPLLDDLQANCRFFIGRQLRDQILRSAGE